MLLNLTLVINQEPIKMILVKLREIIIETLILLINKKVNMKWNHREPMVNTQTNKALIRITVLPIKI